MTFSIAALCPRTGQFGCALATSSMAAGARAPFVAPGFGVVLSQARSDPRLGELGVTRLRDGRPAQEVLDDMLASTPHAKWRQLAVLDRHGGTAAFTGERCTDAKGAQFAPGFVVVGNGLANDAVVGAMAAGFLAADGQVLAERLVVALEHGAKAGGEAFPLRSAGLKVAEPGVPFAPIDLRVDFSDDPIAELRRLLVLWTPMAPAYVTRCLDPDHSQPANEIEGHPVQAR